MVVATKENAGLCGEQFEEITLATIIQKIIRLAPIILLLMMIFVDRGNMVHVTGFLFLLFLYTFILVSRVLYAKRSWHKEFNDENYVNDPNIKKMQDLRGLN